MPAASRFLRKLAEVGPRYACVLALQRALPRRVFGYFRWSLYRLDARAARSQQPVPARWARADELELLCGFGHARETVAGRFARGSLACVLESGGALTACVWFQPREFFDAEARVRFRLRERDIWLYDAMVAPQLRGQGIYPRLLAAAAALLRERGFERIWILIDALNRNSIRAHCAAGAELETGGSSIEVCGRASVRFGASAALRLRPGQERVIELG